MTKKEKLVWRLTKLPTTEELRELVKDKIISQEEAREILFSTETTEENPKAKTPKQEDLESEIKFLRELIAKLAQPSTIIKYVEQVIPIYKNYGWSQPYYYYCSTSTGLTGLAGTGSTLLSSGSTNNGIVGGMQNASFTNIKTF